MIPAPGWTSARLWLLKCQLDAPEERFVRGGLTGGGCDAEGNITATRELDRVGDIRCHGVICIAIAELWLQTCEKLLLPALPGDLDFHAGDLPAV